MPPIWLTRLNDVLTWLNPVLGLVAAVLAAMVVAAAAERWQDPRPTQAVRFAQSLPQPGPAECQQALLPAELRDMLLHD